MASSSFRIGDGILLRPWRLTDKHSLVHYANNYRVWITLRDRFPHPYTEADADAWLPHVSGNLDRPANFAIECDGEAVGGIGLEFMTDVCRITAEIGYWLGEPFWGRGIMTAAVKQVTAYAFDTFPLERLQAMVFSWNTASARVLEKAGYALEARLQRDFIKAGRIGDTLIYARLRNSI